METMIIFEKDVNGCFACRKPTFDTLVLFSYDREKRRKDACRIALCDECQAKTAVSLVKLTLGVFG